MNYLIDTNIISEVRKGDRCNRHVAAWYWSIPDEQVYLSVIVLGELRRGAELKLRNDPVGGRALAKWLELVRKEFAGRIFPVNEAVADEWGRMMAMRNAPAVDALLAATAKVHEMALVTRNIADVSGLGIEIVNPFEPPSRAR